MTTSVDPHVKALRDLLVAEHEAHIAEVQRRADQAAAAGEEWYRRWHQDDADRLRAMTYPWQGEETERDHTDES